MPSEHIYPMPVEQPQQDQPQPQIKVCTSCHSTLVDPAGLDFLPEADAVVCTGCREHFLAARSTLIQSTLCIDVDSSFSRRPPHEGNPSQNTRRFTETPVFDDTMDTGSPSSSSEPELSYHGSLITPPAYSNKLSSLTIQCNTVSSSNLPHNQSHVSAALMYPAAPRRPTNAVSFPNPLTDITRLRVRSQRHHCLYPGASFQGTQKSGRNSYDVNVTIVDVDFSSSFLCGYLRIRGLTDDWPELTTYFDAEIIGSRHGFLTQNWGANENEDMVHWSRFPAFRHVKHELKKPLLTMDDRDRGAVFMRWKERFLVPDHRVQDINGASFAGFYYVCVDFNPPTSTTPTRSTLQNMPLTPEHDSADASCVPSAASLKPEAPTRERRDSNVRRTGRSPSLTPRSSAPAATMSGFYFHQNSEPYQQLSLSHVPDRASSSFEFR